MGRIRNTIELAKTSWGVLQKDRELIALPVIGFVLTLIVVAVFFIPGLLIADLGSETDAALGEEEAIPAASGLLFLLGALGAGVVSIFFSGAVIAVAHERMSGGDPTIGSSIRKAVQRIPGLVPWALLTTTVGLIISALRERAEGLGRFLLGGIELAWDVTTYLTVPAIIIDGQGPIGGLRESAGLLKRTWGENLASRVGFGIVGFVAALPAVALIAVAVASGVDAFVVAGVLLGGLWLALVVAVMSTLGGIFKTALYLYATTGQSPEGFERADLGATFTRR